MLKGKILVIDDNKSILKSLKFFLEDYFEKVEAISNPNLLPSLLREEEFDVFLLDMNFTAGISTGNEGLYWLKKIKKADIDAIVIMITAYGDIDLAVKAMKEGATDFVLKPWDNKKLYATIKTGFELRRSKKELNKLQNRQKIIESDIDKKHSMLRGKCKSMQKIYKTLEKVATTNANVLITGENGTGKELIAREVHRLSKRKQEIFLSVDLSTITDTLFEAELFGFTKGAFTDAKEDRIGKFEAAKGGTLFLDEIGNLPYHAQAKILTVLQNRQITPMGSNKVTHLDFRLVCATNKNLPQLIEKNLFREDLFYRLNTIQIELPPLRERGEDILHLTEYFINSFKNKYEKHGLKISNKAIDAIANYNWPGNIRELKHTIEKAVILCDTKVIALEDLQLKSNPILKNETYKILSLEDSEKKAIFIALERNNWNLSKTAKDLKIGRQTLYNKISKYGL